MLDDRFLFCRPSLLPHAMLFLPAYALFISLVSDAVPLIPSAPCRRREEKRREKGLPSLIMTLHKTKAHLSIPRDFPVILPILVILQFPIKPTPPYPTIPSFCSSCSCPLLTSNTQHHLLLPFLSFFSCGKSFSSKIRNAKIIPSSSLIFHSLFL